MESNAGGIMNEIAVSVIVPVYNTQKYLKECLDSILLQTFKTMEILCIDDGSTDNCGLMLDAYVNQDERVKVFHIPNGGYGHAVNYGLDHAVGKYIGIIEPDDYIEGEMFERLYQVLEKNRLDVVSSNYKCFTGDGEERIFRINEVMDEQKFYNNVLDPFTERSLFSGTFLNQAGLYRRDFLYKYHIRHHESPGASFQDVGFRLQILAYCKRLMILKDAFYCYRKDNPNSSVNNRTDIHRIINEYRFVFDIVNKNPDYLESYLPELTRCKITDYLGEYDRIIPELRQEFIKIVRDEIMDSKQKGKFITKNLSPRQQKRVQYIINEPDNYEQREAKLREEIHMKTKHISAFIIYGAGMFGKKLYDVMWEEDRKKLLGYAVTDITSNMKEYCGVAVKEINEYDRDLTVIVGVTEKYENEVAEFLRKNGSKHIICLESSVWF